MSWWTTKAWPWLKQTGWKIILPVITLLGVIGAIFAKLRPGVTVVDPTEAADERARIEEETRQRQVEAERQRLAEETRRIEASRDAERAAFEAQQRGEVSDLQSDPEKLRQAMLDAGKPRRAP